MDRKIVRIGNSQGIVIPKYILKILGWEGILNLNLEMEENKIILTTPKTPKK